MSNAFQKVYRFITNRKIRFGYLEKMGIFNKLSDEDFLIRKFKVNCGYDLNLVNPQTFNEKIQWLKLHDHNLEYVKMVDKYLVKGYVSDLIGEEHIIPLLGVWDNPEEIDFDSLPDQFVLKCNHTSGVGICICKDKSMINKKNVIKELRRGMQDDYYIHGREWPYKYVDRKIIAEKYMVDESGVELKDYKVFCFDGEPRLIQVDFNRFTDHHRNLYSPSWKFIDKEILYPNDPNHQIAKPKCLDELLRFSSILSKNIPFVRTDFYIINNKIYFGEMTFYHGSGMEPFRPLDFGVELGNMIHLPLDRKD